MGLWISCFFLFSSHLYLQCSISNASFIKSRATHVPIRVEATGTTVTAVSPSWIRPPILTSDDIDAHDLSYVPNKARAWCGLIYLVVTFVVCIVFYLYLFRRRLLPLTASGTTVKVSGCLRRAYASCLRLTIALIFHGESDSICPVGVARLACWKSLFFYCISSLA